MIDSNQPSPVGQQIKHEDEADDAIDIWRYDPAILSDSPVVDVLSLYAQLESLERANFSCRYRPFGATQLVAGINKIREHFAGHDEQ